MFRTVPDPRAALSLPVGHADIGVTGIRDVNMAVACKRIEDWPKDHPTYVDAGVKRTHFRRSENASFGRSSVATCLSIRSRVTKKRDFSNRLKKELPLRRSQTYGVRWLHSDIKDMAYLYVYRAYNVFVDEGGLK